MKQLILLLAFATFGFSATANSDLQENMKLVGQSFRTIVMGIQAQAMTELELEASKTLQRALTDSASIFPDTANTPELQLRYTDLMNQTIQKAQELEDHIETQLGQDPQDLSQVIATFGELNTLRQMSHSEFKPQD